MQEGVAARLGLELEADGAEDRLEDALGREERHRGTRDQGADRPGLVGQLPAGPRLVAVGDLVDRELLPSQRLVARGDVGEARQEQRPHRRMLGRERVREHDRRHARQFSEVIRPALAEHGIRVVSCQQSGAPASVIERHFREQIFPVLTPLAVGPGRPFPYISNLSLSLAVLVRDPITDQTVFAREAGSSAAPTAGLHLTEELLARLDVERVTLHVGLDTFRPLVVEDLDEHVLHGERYAVASDTWERTRGADRVLAVGTTTVRVLESLARGAPLAGRTSLFVTPGFEFRRVDALLTNFHLPRSTLLALVMAFAGVEETRSLYAEAIRERYRFYSFGDALLVL